MKGKRKGMIPDEIIIPPRDANFEKDVKQSKAIPLADRLVMALKALQITGKEVSLFKIEIILSGDCVKVSCAENEFIVRTALDDFVRPYRAEINKCAAEQSKAMSKTMADLVNNRVGEY